MAKYFNHSQFKTTSKMAYIYTVTLLAVIASVSAKIVSSYLSIIDSSIQNLITKVDFIMS